MEVEPMGLTTPIHPERVRFVCISDTHNRADELEELLPDGDVFLHCGDFTDYGTVEEVKKFNEFLGRLPHRHKIVIAGNHEMTFDENVLPMTGEVRDHRRMTQSLLLKNRNELTSRGLTHMSQLLTNCIYLQDSMTTVHGLRIYGSPWQPQFCEWAFNLGSLEELREVWDKIPEGIDVLMTHGPPFGRGDRCTMDVNGGCPELLLAVQNRVRPKFHVYGHIHEGRDPDWNEDEGFSTDGITTFINAAVLNRSYKLVFPPVIFDVPLPPGYSRTGTPCPEHKSTSLDKRE